MAQGVNIDANQIEALNRVADRFFGAVEKGDVDTVKEIYSPDARIWHNFDNYASTREENLGVLKWVGNHVENFRFEEVRRSYLPGAVLQQHVIRGRDEAGNEINCPAILKVDVQGENITRIEEYFDASQMPELGTE
jgi:uncharacterized protein